MSSTSIPSAATTLSRAAEAEHEEHLHWSTGWRLLPNVIVAPADSTYSDERLRHRIGVCQEMRQ